MACRENIHLGFFSNNLTCEWVQRVDCLNLIPEELNANSVLLIHGNNLDGVSPNAERSAVKIHIITGVLHSHKLTQQVIPVNLIPSFEGYHLLHILLGSTQTVDTRNG